MSPARDFGPSNDHNDDNQPGNHNHNQEEDHDMTTPDPATPDDQPEPERAIEAPKQPGDRLDVDTPSVGQLYAMFPDAMPKSTPQRRTRHLAAVPDSGDVATLAATTFDDDEDPWVAAALRWRAIIAFWWRPAATGIVVVAIAVCAFFAASVAVGIAWCVYGIGWTSHSIWHVHGRPSVGQLARNWRGGGW